MGVVYVYDKLLVDERVLKLLLEEGIRTLSSTFLPETIF